MVKIHILIQKRWSKTMFSQTHGLKPIYITPKTLYIIPWLRFLGIFVAVADDCHRRCPGRRSYLQQALNTHMWLVLSHSVCCISFWALCHSFLYLSLHSTIVTETWQFRSFNYLTSCSETGCSNFTLVSLMKVVNSPCFFHITCAKIVATS